MDSEGAATRKLCQLDQQVQEASLLQLDQVPFKEEVFAVALAPAVVVGSEVGSVAAIEEDLEAEEEELVIKVEVGLVEGADMVEHPTALVTPRHHLPMLLLALEGIVAASDLVGMVAAVMVAHLRTAI